MPSRVDLSDWVIHFVHDHNPDIRLFDADGEDIDTALAYTPEGRPIRSDFDLFRQDEPLDPRASAFDVLLRILDDGYLRASWSIRNQKPTIYGPTAAVCFTEMPLFALIQYHKERANRGYVGRYAIALKKAEFFQQGGRPVIYGLSGMHTEEKVGAANFAQTRNLSESCGIGMREQYRYVAMSLGGNKRIDWSHEREWRWTKEFKDGFDFPGLPIWAKAYDAPCGMCFSRVLIITETQNEAREVVNKLKEYDDSGYNNFDTQFDKTLLRSTYVTSFEELAKLNPDPNIRIEDIPFSDIGRVQVVAVSNEMLKRVKSAHQLAKREAAAAAEEYKKPMRQDEKGRLIHSGFGWANVITYDSHSEAVQALKQLGLADPIGGIGYFLTDVTASAKTEHSLEIESAAAQRAAEILTKELGQEFLVRKKWD